MARPVTRPERALQPAWYNRHLEGLRRAARAAKRNDPRSTRATTLQAQYKRELQRAKRRHKRQRQMSLVQMARNKSDMRGSFPERPAEQADTETSRVARLEGSPAADGAEMNAPFTAAEVVRGINALRLGACTLGLLTVEALRLAGPLLAACLASLLNLCAAAGMSSSNWAMSAITPIHKSGDELDPNNYRGIAVGTAIAKLYATMLNQRLTAWSGFH